MLPKKVFQEKNVILQIFFSGNSKKQWRPLSSILRNRSLTGKEGFSPTRTTLFK